MVEKFSKRHGFNEIQDVPITTRYDAPHDLRGVLVDIAYEFGFTPKLLRSIVCQILRARPDEDNWSDFPNIDMEVRRLLDGCAWYKVYDVLEAITQKLDQVLSQKTEQEFHEEINAYFLEKGIGWQLVNKQVTYRGDEGLERILKDAVETQYLAQHKTASNELHEAIKDMSRRPNADVTGVIQHAMASLECVARDITGSKSTLGEWIKNNASLFPKPIDEVIKKLWGFTSEHGRHLKEAEEPTIEEAELVLGLSATLGSYLAKKGSIK
jgi:hypothetical protein